ncbi:Hypothetical protein R9X50_00665500 [Acrodontium crateriforme]|uniref:Inositol polyphosphate-related phosphatase domain-containing protein n=1 Tax=Acrodontium crateriforme TaxID=150365 RepID=A0AAQ3MA61_9PEZI|nr:Hypothetical protein R9X50_00665500 [Acrodontium crateriforme]
MASSNERPDDAPIGPVSSLRSRFENLGKDDVSKDSKDASKFGHSQGKSLAVPTGTAGNGSSHARPQSMIEMTPSKKQPPIVTVQSPQSPHLQNGDPRTPVPPGKSSPRGHAKTLSRAASPLLEEKTAPFTNLPSASILASKPIWEPAKVIPAGSQSPRRASATPPPVNRAAKPRIPNKPTALSHKSALSHAETGSISKPNKNLAAPEQNTAELTDHSVSPFSTPPSSREQSPIRKTQNYAMQSQLQRQRNESDGSTPYASRAESLAFAAGRVRAKSDASFVERLRSDSSSSLAEPSPISESVTQMFPVHHDIAARGDQLVNGQPRPFVPPVRHKSMKITEHALASDLPDDRPRLPVRPELQVRSGRTSPTKSRSGRTSPSKLKHEMSMKRSIDGLKRAATLDEQRITHQRIPAVKPAQISALHLGFDRSPQATAAQVSSAPAIPSPRRSTDRREPPPPPRPASNSRLREGETEVIATSSTINPVTSLSEFPDASQASRRPPRYPRRPFLIPTDYETKLLAVCGEYVCTSGYITKVWTLRTGELLMNMVHGEGVKVTSLAFKPMPRPEDEGKRIWLGTNSGEILEVDVPSQSVVKSKSGAHLRREIIRMFRHASELWTLDDSGELCVWKPDQKGLPTLDSSCNTFRVPRGHTSSLVCGKYLWIATGKDIRVFLPSARSDAEFQVLRHPLSQPGIGDVTAAATLSSNPELVYFGHSDGKVSIYNQHDYSCIGVVNISLYRISTLLGVGEYLWAGYSTGMAYIYDTSRTPWRVKKDWQAHEKQISSIVADPSALWKLDRLQVISLGTDNTIRLWDGYLEDDWLEIRMQNYDTEYCSFREISAAVLTWNAGAAKPHYLQQSPEDNNFFREYLGSSEPADILVFGFQELVDLENKRTTAKSFFKSKKTDSSEQQHMSHQYRAWRDHLTKCIDDFMPVGQTYSLLHTSSMVGLFTCVFVKSTLKSCIKHIHTSEIKRGMGGLHGNKGALVMRLVLDDSSLCFINCHLAAGQTQTLHRNNDVAAILESESLPAYPLANGSVAKHSDVFACGGDGSMIMDHEICILNGDLNYRIDTMGRDTVVKHVQGNNLSRLLERDQLLLSRKKNPGFRLRAFQENPINFAPTYKYNVHTDEYDTSEKRRAPAWCDRILYRGLKNVKMEEYRRWELRVSDHRPVSGRLRLRVKTVDEHRRVTTWDKCQRELDASRKRIAKAVHLEYLVNVLGLSAQEAASALK